MQWTFSSRRQRTVSFEATHAEVVSHVSILTLVHKLFEIHNIHDIQTYATLTQLASLVAVRLGRSRTRPSHRVPNA